VKSADVEEKRRQIRLYALENLTVGHISARTQFAAYALATFNTSNGYQLDSDFR